MRHTTLYLINVKSLAAVSSFLHKALNPNYNFSTLAAYYLTFDVLSDNGENYRPNYKGDNVIKMELSRCWLSHSARDTELCLSPTTVLTWKVLAAHLKDSKCIFMTVPVFSGYNARFQVHVRKLVSDPDIDADILSMQRENCHRRQYEYTRNLLQPTSN
jgi:hypothetical protein